MTRTVLIVDDSEINRQILRKILSGVYRVVEAENGELALEMLGKRGADISAVLLDIVMPVMDGYEVLAHMQADEALKQIPVIVTTGNAETDAELKALKLGASDYIVKPYQAAMILHRLHNTIHFRETAALINSVQRDELTGLYNRQAFFRRVEEMVGEREPGYYMISCLNVDNFKVINDQYGSSKGDEVLRLIADALRHNVEEIGGICCRMMADHFAVLLPRRYVSKGVLAVQRGEAAVLAAIKRPVVIRVGRYLIDDLSLSVSAMYDRASIAEDSIKGRFDVQSAMYDEGMREQILRQQSIINEMDAALVSRQFEVWYQPQYNHTTGALIGAEALVRWRHPDKGIIPPNEFIPVFERNGFIYELDKYVWGRVCYTLRKWLDEGRSPLPVSVNVSRYDVYRDDFFDELTGFIHRNNLPPSLLRIEITESAFAHDAEQLIAMVKRMSEYGFTIEIDDFGSGYSSLNTLKDVPANILKLDMRFLKGEDNMQRGGNILESVIRMAKWLGMPVIAEGVESTEQADFLRSIGCEYVQGYLYSRPLPLAEYEALARASDKEEKMLALVTVETLDNNAFWDPKSMDTLIFNSYVGGACIMEYHDGNLEMLRANQKYAQSLGGEGALSVGEALALSWTDYLDRKSLQLLFRSIRKAVETKDEVTSEYVFLDLPGCADKTYLRASLRVIASSGVRYLVYCTCENTTAQHAAEMRSFETSERLQAIMDHVSCGITAVIESNERPRYIFVNDRYFEMLGYTRRQYMDEVHDSYSVVHPDDRAMVMRSSQSVAWTGDPVTIEYRAIRRDGSVIWLRNSISLIQFTGMDEPAQLSNCDDITEQKEIDQKLRSYMEKIRTLNKSLTELMNDMPGGFVRMRLKLDGTPTPVYINQGFSEMLGMTRDEISDAYRHDAMFGVHPDDVALVQGAISMAIKRDWRFNIRYRLRLADGEYAPVAALGRLTQSEQGERFLNVYYVDGPDEIPVSADHRGD